MNAPMTRSMNDQEPLRVIGYTRVSTAEQADSGLGLEAQEHALRREAEYRGWDLTLIADAGRSGASMHRPGIRKALRALAAGEYDALAVAKLDRLSRSSADAAQVFAWFKEVDRRLILLDLNVDTGDAVGQLVAQIMASIAEYERNATAQRTRVAMAALRRQGKPISRAAVADNPELVARLRTLRDRGLSYQAIADTLNSEGVPTLRGGSMWRVSSVQTALGYVRKPKPKRSSALPPTRVNGRRPKTRR